MFSLPVSGLFFSRVCWGSDRLRLVGAPTFVSGAGLTLGDPSKSGDQTGIPGSTHREGYWCRGSGLLCGKLFLTGREGSRPLTRENQMNRALTGLTGSTSEASNQTLLDALRIGRYLQCRAAEIGNTIDMKALNTVINEIVAELLVRFPQAADILEAWEDDLDDLRPMSRVIQSFVSGLLGDRVSGVA